MSFSFGKAIVSAAITGVIVSSYIPPSHGEVLAIASPLATVAGILFGFIIASVSLFSSASENELITSMKSTNMYAPLMSELSSTGLALISSCIFMVISIFTPAKLIYSTYALTWDYLLLIVGFFCLVYALIEFWSCWRKIHLVIKNM